MAKRGRKPLNRGWRLQQQSGHPGPGIHGHQNVQQQKYERLRSQRLNPEQIGTSVHDESDTISFRNYLLENYILTTEWINVLTTQPVPCNRILKHKLYPEGLSVEVLREQLEAQEREVKQLKERLQELEKGQQELTDSDFLKECNKELRKDPLDKETLTNMQEKYERRFGLSIKPGPIVVHHNMYNLSAVMVNSKAPDNYWTEVYPQIQQRKLLLQEQLERERQESEQLLKLQLEEEERKRKSQEESEQQLQMPDSEPAVPTNQPPTNQEAGNQMLDTMFNDMENEPFNTAFDDAFGDLDGAFF